MNEDRTHLYRRLPPLGEYLQAAEARALLQLHPRTMVLDAARRVLARMRDAIAQGLTKPALDAALTRFHASVIEALEREERASLRPVINATGVILQTNLGRAPLSRSAIEHIAAVAAGYCNLEFDLASGERSQRGAHAEQLVLKLVCDERSAGEAQAALVVNNCAAATFLALNSLAEGGEVIVSRGELVEIGGGFRVPDILRKSGAVLREVGTTNRTRLQDYADAINENTRLILRVHPSNFQIEGFTERPELRALIELGNERGLPVFEDQGTGCVVNLESYGIGQQSSFAASIRSGAALVCASGDKLLGGPQCGLVVGAENLVQRLKKNPLYRAFRVDKLTYAGLQATLLSYLKGEAETLPAIRMLSLRSDSIRERCRRWAAALGSDRLHTAVVETRSVVGGGTTPGASLPSYAVALHPIGMSETQLSARLRALDPPVVARIQEGRVLLDLRTVPEEQDAGVIEAMLRGLRVPASSELEARR